MAMVAAPLKAGSASKLFWITQLTQTCRPAALYSTHIRRTAAANGAEFTSEGVGELVVVQAFRGPLAPAAAAPGMPLVAFLKPSMRSPPDDKRLGLGRAFIIRRPCALLFHLLTHQWLLADLADKPRQNLKPVPVFEAVVIEARASSVIAIRYSASHARPLVDVG